MASNIIVGSPGDDVLTGTGGADIFELGQGGNDTASGLDGGDQFRFGATFTAADRIDGGAGTDALLLAGDYSAGITFAAATMANVESIVLGAGFSYALTENDANLAPGQTLAVNGVALAPGQTLTFDGSSETDGRFVLIGGASGGDVLIGGQGDDVINLRMGGSDRALGNGGDDLFVMGAALDPFDQIDGGSGNDAIVLNGGYCGLTLGRDTLTSVETMLLAAGHSYNIAVSPEAALGPTFRVNASALGAGDAVTFDALQQSLASDTAFSFVGGGIDTFRGGGASDLFLFGGNFTASDRLDGGGAADLLRLSGDYSAGLSLGPDTIADVAQIQLGVGFSYAFTENDANLAAGQTMIVNAAGLSAGETLIFDGSQETDGNFVLIGGAGNDTLTGGSKSDTIDGGAGNDIIDLSRGGGDVVHGGAGDDLIHSTNGFSPFDVIDGGGGNDTLELDLQDNTIALPGTVDGVETTLLKLTSNQDYTLTLPAAAAFLQSLTVDATASASLALDASNGPPVMHLIGGNGNDTWNMGASLTPADILDGGKGRNIVELDGDYSGSHALVLGPSQFSAISQIAPHAGFSYDLTLQGDNGGIPLTVEAVAGTSFDDYPGLRIDASAMTVSLLLDGSRAQDLLIGGSANDEIFEGRTGATIEGNGGNDNIFDIDVDSTTKIDGGPGDDTVVLAGGPAEFLGVTLGPQTLINVETVIFTDGIYTLDDGNVAAGATLTIDETTTSGIDALAVDGSAETDGHFIFKSGQVASEAFVGGALSDTFELTKSDTITGGGGGDLIVHGGSGAHIIYNAASDSTSVNYDTIQGFSTADTITVPWGNVTTHSLIPGGPLSTASFDSDLAAVANAGNLPAHSAVIFEADAGNLIRQNFLVIDLNGIPGYQAGDDLVIHIAWSATLPPG